MGAKTYNGLDNLRNS